MSTYTYEFLSILNINVSILNILFLVALEFSLLAGINLYISSNLCNVLNIKTSTPDGIEFPILCFYLI